MSSINPPSSGELKLIVVVLTLVVPTVWPFQEITPRDVDVDVGYPPQAMQIQAILFVRATIVVTRAQYNAIHAIRRIVFVEYIAAVVFLHQVPLYRPASEIPIEEKPARYILVEK